MDVPPAPTFPTKSSIQPGGGRLGAFARSQLLVGKDVCGSGAVAQPENGPEEGRCFIRSLQEPSVCDGAPWRFQVQLPSSPHLLNL